MCNSYTPWIFCIALGVWSLELGAMSTVERKLFVLVEAEVEHL